MTTKPDTSAITKGPEWRREPPWRRYIVMCPDGRPTGWAMGISPGSAARAWIDCFGECAKADRVKRWERARAEGYSVAAFDITPVAFPDIEDAVLGELQ